MRDYDIRTLPAVEALTDEVAAWCRACALGFLEPDAPEEHLQHLARTYAADRTTLTGAYPRRPLPGLAPDTPVATFGAFNRTLNTGAGHLEPIHLISDVTVRPSHRRRGLLRAMMTADLDAAAAAGLPLAALTASEATIYGRFGFAPATFRQNIELDTRRAGLPAPAAARIEVVEAASAAPLLDQVFAGFHAATRGSIDRPAYCAEHYTGVWDFETRGPNRGVRVAVHFDEDDRPDGHVAYTFEEKERTVVVRDLVSADPAVELALWHFVASIDLVRTARFERLGPASPLRWAVADSRALTTTGHRDLIWLRVLDVAAALRIRGWDSMGAIGFTVTDPLGHAAGSWRLEVGEDGAQVTAIASAALTVSERALAAIYLGATDARVLGAAGLVAGPAEQVAELARLFRTDLPAHCLTFF